MHYIDYDLSGKEKSVLLLHSDAPVSGHMSCSFSGFLDERKLTFLIMQDGPERMAEEAKLFKYPFPYLYDEVCLHSALCLRFNDYQYQ
jgi:hypothetical protein